MNIVQRQIASGPYDAYYRDGLPAFDSASNQTYAGFYTDAGYQNMSSFFGFAGVTLRGRIIKSYIQVYITEVSGTITLKLGAYAVHAPVMPNSEVTAATILATLTTAQIDWDGPFALGWNTSPDISTILQELVSDYGVSNSYVIIVLKNDGAVGNDYIELESYNQVPAQSAKLWAEWTYPTGNLQPLVSRMCL